METKKNFTYYGLELDHDTVLNNLNKDIEDLQKSFHITLKFGTSEKDVNEVLGFLGSQTTIKVIGIGEYTKEIDGEQKLANIGLQIDKDSLGEFSKLYANKSEPHVTLWITKETDSKGKKIGKAFETRLCDFKPCEPFEVAATFGLYDQENKFYSTLDEKQSEIDENINLNANFCDEEPEYDDYER